MKKKAIDWAALNSATPNALLLLLSSILFAILLGINLPYCKTPYPPGSLQEILTLIAFLFTKPFLTLWENGILGLIQVRSYMTLFVTRMASYGIVRFFFGMVARRGMDWRKAYLFTLVVSWLFVSMADAVLSVYIMPYAYITPQIGSDLESIRHENKAYFKRHGVFAYQTAFHDPFRELFSPRRYKYNPKSISWRIKRLCLVASEGEEFLAGCTFTDRFFWRTKHGLPITLGHTSATRKLTGEPYYERPAQQAAFRVVSPDPESPRP